MSTPHSFTTLVPTRMHPSRMHTTHGRGHHGVAFCYWPSGISGLLLLAFWNKWPSATSFSQTCQYQKATCDRRSLISEGQYQKAKCARRKVPDTTSKGHGTRQEVTSYPLWTNRCKNITFPQLRWREVKCGKRK